MRAGTVRVRGKNGQGAYLGLGIHTADRLVTVKYNSILVAVKEIIAVPEV